MKSMIAGIAAVAAAAGGLIMASSVEPNLPIINASGIEINGLSTDGGLVINGNDWEIVDADDDAAPVAPLPPQAPTAPTYLASTPYDREQADNELVDLLGGAQPRDEPRPHRLI